MMQVFTFNQRADAVFTRTELVACQSALIGMILIFSIACSSLAVFELIALF